MLTKSGFLDLGDRSRLLLVFPGIDPAYQYKGWSSLTGSVYAIGSGSLGANQWHAYFNPCLAFDPDTVTWNTKPSSGNYIRYYNYNYVTGSGWFTVDMNEEPSATHQQRFSPSVDPSYLWIEYSETSDTMKIYGSASSNKPYITVVFDDDDAYLKFKNLYPADGSVVVSGMDQRFSWATEQSANTATELTQTSATFQWKKPSDVSWTDVMVSGNTKYVTIPAGTFTGGKIEWRVVMTDVTGHTRTSSTMTAYTTATLSCSAAVYGSEIVDDNIPYVPTNTYTLRAATARMLIAKYAEIPSAIRYYKLVQARFRAHFIVTAKKQGFNLYGLTGSADIPSVTYPGPDRVTGSYGFGTFADSVDEEMTLPNYFMAASSSYPVGASQELKDAIASKAILTSDCVRVQAYSDAAWSITGPLAMEIAYDDSVTVTSKVKQKNCPTSGWVNPAIANTFAWEFVTYDDWPCAGGFVQASASFFWKEQDDVSWNEVQASGTTQSVTIAANTFPGGTIEWYISATDTNGTTTITPTYTISTEDTIPTATPFDPVDVPVTGNKPIQFRWTVSNDSGTQPTQSDLQVSEDGGTTWTALTSIVGSGKTYTAPANSFTAETVLWRVRAFNRDSVAGSWSAAASFVNITAPAPPSVTAVAVPFATINWQASGQQAYRITVDGVLIGPFFGTVKTHTLEDYLEDGEHTITVEVQGAYGLWSDPGSVTITIANVPGDPVALTAAFKIDGELAWATDSADADFLVYRNGARIGHTAKNIFRDRRFLGQAEYTVLNRLSSGNYTKSNTVGGEIAVETAYIAPLEGGEWLEIRLTDRSQTEQTYNYSRQHSVRHVMGSRWPVLELSPFENETASFDTAFPDAESAKPFEELLGRPVLIKSRGFRLTAGALATVRRITGDFYISYEFTVSRIHLEDLVYDEDD